MFERFLDSVKREQTHCHAAGERLLEVIVLTPYDSQIAPIPGYAHGECGDQ
jgi:hypothetical protein